MCVYVMGMEEETCVFVCDWDGGGDVCVCVCDGMSRNMTCVQTDWLQIPLVYTFRSILLPVCTCIQYKYVYTYIQYPSAYI